jgi:hypothetical protein
MIEFLVTVLVLCIVLYVVYLILGMLHLPAPIMNIIYLIIGLIVIVWLLNYFGIWTGGLNRPFIK